MKKSRVIWSAEALLDLEIIYDFLAEKSVPPAQRIIESILARSKQLETFPESGPKADIKNKTKEYRYLIEGNIKIIYSYRPEIQTVYIEVIFDTRYNPDKLNV